MSYTNTPHAKFSSNAGGNQIQGNYYPDHDHDVPNGEPLPPMHPTSSSLFPAAREYYDHITQNRVVQLGPALRFPNADRISFVSELTIAQAMAFPPILFNGASEDAGRALSGLPIKLWVKLPGSTTYTTSVTIAHSNPAIRFTMKALLLQVATQFNLCVRSHYVNKGTAQAKQYLEGRHWLNYRIRYLERIPGDINEWKLEYIAA